MAVVQLDAAQKLVLDALSAAMDSLFTDGAEQPPGTPVLPALAAYPILADINGQDLRPSLKQSLGSALASLMTGVPAWVAPTLAGSWAPYGGSYNPPGYYKDILGQVHLRGLVANGAGTIFTLPVGYRPAFDHIYSVAAWDGVLRVVCHVYARADGVVYVEFPVTTMAWVSLDSILFRAA